MPCNIHRGAAATALAACLLAAPVVAQVALPPAPSPALSRAPDSGIRILESSNPNPPDPLVTMHAFQALDAWVRDWSVGSPEGLPIARAAAVTLRLDGEIIGRGLDVAVRPEGDSAVTVLAAKAALAEAESRLAIPRDALYEETLRGLAKRITISLELAGPLVPFSPKDWLHASLEIEPGVEGVGVRMGDRTAVMFPEAMIVTATEAAAAFPSLVSRLSGDPTMGLKPPAKLADESGVVFYRFRTSHLAQPREGAAPEFLHRCGKVFEQRDLTAAELRRWADEMARWLTHQTKTNPLSAGTYNPVPGSTESRQDAANALLVARALDQYEAIADAQRKAAALDASANILSEVVNNTDEPRIWEGPVASAMLVLSYHAGNGIRIGIPKEILQKARDITQAQFDPAKGFQARLQPSSRSIIAAALPWYSPPGPAREALQMLYRESGPAGLVNHMPWLGQLEMLQSHIEGVAQHGWSEDSLFPVKGAQILRDMRDLVWQHQLRPLDLTPDRQDLAGAIVFTSGGAPRPTWQAARPLAFIATMLGDPRLTDDAEVPAELSRLLASLRFLRQLTAGEAEAHMYRSPDKAIGGVRASLFDQRMPPEATALTLIAVCETIRSLEAIEQRRSEQAGDKPAAP